MHSSTCCLAEERPTTIVVTTKARSGLEEHGSRGAHGNIQCLACTHPTLVVDVPDLPSHQLLVSQPWKGPTPRSEYLHLLDHCRATRTCGRMSE